MQKELIEQGSFSKILLQDVKTRWNSTYTLIDRYILLYKYVSQIILDLAKNSKKKRYKKYQAQLLSENELELANIIRDILKPFLFVTNLLSSEQTTTIDLVIHSCLYLRHKIATFEHSSQYTKSVKLLIYNSYIHYIEKYEILSNPLLITAGFLNPRYRSFTYSTREEFDNFVEISKNYMIKLTKELSSNQNEANVISTPHSARSNDSFFVNAPKRQSETSLVALEKEILLYLKDSYIDELSQYWITRQSVYPTLFKLARQILSCPGTSVTSERLFSNASDQMWAKRNRLSVDSFEKLMLIYSSLKI